MKTLGVSSLIFLLVTLGWGARSFGEQVPTPRGELRIVDNHHFNWTWIALNVFEHLIEYDKDGTLVPRLATSWQWLDARTLEFKLRRGVKFHNGEVFDAEIVKLNWEENTRLKQPLMVGRFMNFRPGSRLESSIRTRSGSTFPNQMVGHWLDLASCTWATVSFIANSAGVRRTGEFSTLRVRGARDRISWWKVLPPPTFVPSGSSLKPTWSIGTLPGLRNCTVSSLITP